MSKKAKNKQENRSPKISQIQVPTGMNSMINWIIPLVLILPVLFSREERDTVLTIRYIFLGCFLLLFLIYFYLLKKTAGVSSYPSVIKLIFGLGISFTLWGIISMITSQNVAPGYFDMGRYLLNLIFLFIIMEAVRQEPTGLLKLCKALLIGSIIQSFVGILQYYQIAFTDLPGNSVPYGLMANRNLFGSAQVLLLPFVIFVLYKAEKKWKYIATIALMAVIISIVLSQTRASWIATVCLFVTSLILVLFYSDTNKKKWAVFTGGAFVLLILLGILLISLDKEGTLTNSVTVRLTSIKQLIQGKSVEKEVNINSRFAIWKKTNKLIAKYPVKGVGPGNWKTTIQSYGTENTGWASGTTIPDRPHNVYLLLTAETGFIGAFLYFGVWILLFFAAFKVIVKSKGEDQLIVNILAISGLAAFVIDSMFSFPNERIEHSLYFLLFAGIILGSNLSNVSQGNNSEKPINKYFKIAALLVILFNIFLGVTKHNFENHLNRANYFKNEKQYQFVIDEVELAKNNWVTTDNESKSLELYSSIAYKELKMYDKAIEEINIALQYNPSNPMIYNNLGTIYTDMNQYEKAIEAYKKSIKLAPEFEVAYKNLAYNYFVTNQYQFCIDALAKVNAKDDNNLVGLLNEAKIRVVNQKSSLK